MESTVLSKENLGLLIVKRKVGAQLHLSMHKSCIESGHDKGGFIVANLGSFIVFTFSHQLEFEAVGAQTCFSCIRQMTSSRRDPRAYQCPDCRKIFCSDCDLFIHDSLHSCPGTIISFLSVV